MKIRSSRRVVMIATSFVTLLSLSGCTTQPSLMNKTLVANHTNSSGNGQSSAADNKVSVNDTTEAQTVSTSSQVTWSVKSITVSPATMTAGNQKLHAFRYIIMMTPKGTLYGNPPNQGRPFNLPIHFSGETQNLLDVTKDHVLLSLANRASLTYRAIWESLYLPNYPKGTLAELSTNISDLSLQVKSRP